MADRRRVPWGEPPRSRYERLTDAFYQWERRGRGWQVWEDPVELEPPFRPFLGHYVPAGPAIDDARKPTFFSALIERLRGRSTDGPATSPSLGDVSELGEAEPEPALDERSALATLQVALPPEIRITHEVAEQCLLSLSYCSGPVGFEVVGLPPMMSNSPPLMT